MTVIHKSNVNYSGSANLSPIVKITKSAADLYAIYAARVAADAGTIGDPTACLAAISAALNGDYYWRGAIAVSPRWGYKSSGGVISKLYNLFGAIDGIATGSVGLDTTTKGYNTAKFLTGSDVLTFTGVNVNVSGVMGYVASSYRASSTIGVYFTFTVAGQQWQFREFSGSAYVNGVLEISDGLTVPNNAAEGILIEQAVGRFTIARNGGQIIINTNTITQLAANATANVTLQLTTPSQTNISEAWYLNAASQLAALACSYDVGARS